VTHELRFLERLRQHATSLLHLPLSAIGLYAERETPATSTRSRSGSRTRSSRRGSTGSDSSAISSRRSSSATTLCRPRPRSRAGSATPTGRSQATANSTSRCSSARTARRPTVYAHWEPSWIRHPIRHYRAIDVDAETGIARTRRLFERADIRVHRGAGGGAARRHGRHGLKAANRVRPGCPTPLWRRCGRDTRRCARVPPPPPRGPRPPRAPPVSSSRPEAGRAARAPAPRRRRCRRDPLPRASTGSSSSFTPAFACSAARPR